MTTLPTLKELLDTRCSALELKMLIVSLQMQTILKKYRPDQPRVPAGSAAGGQWTAENSEADTKVAGKWDDSRAGLCDEQLRLDEELCRTLSSRLCWSLSIDRYAACMKNNFVPKLRF